MRAHPQVVGVQLDGCKALLSVCGVGASAAVRARRLRAALVGGRILIQQGMQAHPDNARLQHQGQEVLNVLPEWF